MARTVGSVGTETADRVRQAALVLFARHGYAAVSMRQIARETDLHAGAIYNHFPTKQHLLHGLMVDHMERLLSAWERHAQSGVTAADALIDFVRFHIRYHTKRGEEVFISYMELRNLETDNFSAVEKLRERYERNLGEILAAGIRDGSFHIADLRVTTMAIIAMLTGITNWYRSDGRLDLAEIEDVYVDLVGGAVGMKENGQCS